jgi:hypothetical protein
VLIMLIALRTPHSSWNSTASTIRPIVVREASTRGYAWQPAARSVLTASAGFWQRSTPQYVPSCRNARSLWLVYFWPFGSDAPLPHGHSYCIFGVA